MIAAREDFRPVIASLLLVYLWLFFSLASWELPVSACVSKEPKNTGMVGLVVASAAA